MSRQQRSSNQSVSLFPFLAVLVCAMGALIFLLVVTTRRIRVQAIVRAHELQSEKTESRKPAVALPVVVPEPAPVAKPQPLPSPPRSNQKELEWKGIVARLKRRLEDRKNQLRTMQSATQVLEARARNRETELAAAERGLERAAAQRSDNARSVREIELLRGRLSVEKDEIEQRIHQVRLANSNATSKYAFLPIDGNSGTTRRPVLVECTSEAIRFLPEDVAVTPADLDGFTVEYNPLLAGAKALVQYWELWTRTRRVADEEPEPYILLIVRPSGTVSFYVARKLLETLGTRYGYELVDENWEFDLPDVDPKAQIICRTAVDAVLQQREQLAASLAVGRLSQGQLRLNPANRHFELEDQSSGTGRRNSAADRDGLIGQGGDGYGNDAIRDGDRGGAGNKRSGLATEGRGTGTQRWSASDNRLANGGGFGNSNEMQEPPIRPRVIEFPRRAAEPGTHNHTKSQTGETGRRSRFETAHGGRSENVLPDTFPPGEGRLQNPHLPKLGERFRQSAENGDLLGQDDGDRLGGKGTVSNASEEAGSGSGNATFGSETPTDGRGQSMGTGWSDKKGPSTGGSGKGESGDGQEQKTAAADGNATVAFDTGPRSAHSANGSARSSSGGNGGAGSSPGGEGPAMPSLSKTFGSTGSGDPRVQSIKKQWGVAKPRASIGFEREVTIQIDADRIVVANAYSIPAGKGEGRDELVDKVVTALDQHARSWGSPPGNFYWVPSIKFVVSPGGNQHYERLHPQLRRWGLFSTVKFTLDAAPEATNNTQPVDRVKR